MSLNEQIAQTVFGWKSKRQGLFKVRGWFDGYTYKGCEWGLTLPNWSHDLTEAFSLLGRHNWDLHTCDAGYRCRIFKAPERGEELLGDGVGETICEAICRAVLAAGPILRTTEDNQP